MSQNSDNPQRDTWIELGLNVVLPTVVLIFLSDEDRLGPVLALVLGLSFPIAHSVYSRLRGEAISPLSVIAFIGVLFSGGIGLLELEARWFAVKEAVLPLVMALFCALSRFTQWPVVDTLIFRLLDSEKVHLALTEKGQRDVLGPMLSKVNAVFIGGFFYSSVASYFLARYLVVSPGGTEAYNVELGTFTFVSFPVVAVPLTVAMGFALNSMLNGLEKATELEIDDLLRPGLAPAKAAEEA